MRTKPILTMFRIYRLLQNFHAKGKKSSQTVGRNTINTYTVLHNKLRKS